MSLGVGLEMWSLKVKNYEVQDFVNCVASIDLIDIRAVWVSFYWASPKVCSKLDRDD